MNRLALLAVVALAGCEAAAASPPTRAHTAASASVASAALASASVASAASSPTANGSLGALATRSLGGSSLAAMQLLATADGRATLASVVSCALPAGASITVIARDGTPYSFAGRAGAAPGWAQRAPSLAERQRVAACLARPIHVASR